MHACIPALALAPPAQPAARERPPSAPRAQERGERCAALRCACERVFAPPLAAARARARGGWRGAREEGGAARARRVARRAMRRRRERGCARARVCMTRPRLAAAVLPPRAKLEGSGSSSSASPPPPLLLPPPLHREARARAGRGGYAPRGMRDIPSHEARPPTPTHTPPAARRPREFAPLLLCLPPCCWRCVFLLRS